MVETVCPEHEDAEAERWKGEVTVLPFTGLATLGLSEEEPLELTVTATSLTQTAPALPHDLT